MAIEITVPRLGWSMDEGVFSEWLKNDGDFVRESDAIFVLESEKATQEIESFESGILRIPPDAPQPGDTVKVGQVLAFICRQGESAPFDSPATANDMESPENSPPPQIVGDTDFEEISDGRPTHTSSDPGASPSVRRLARELGVDLKVLAANQIAQRVTAQHVQASASKQSELTTEVHFDGKSRFRVSPRAARAAAKLGVSLSEVTSTGTSGRIRERDVLEAFARRRATTVQPVAAEQAVEHVADTNVAPPKSPIPPKVTSATPSQIRRTIAARMLAAAQETASVTLMATADATTLVTLRKQYKAGHKNDAVRVPTFADLFVKLSAAALHLQPALLSQWTDQGVVVPDGVHVSLAVDTPLGLLTPVVHNVSSMSLQQIGEVLATLIARARAGRLSVNEQNGGTFTLTNLGRYRVEGFTPLLNLPQSAILGIGRIAPQPVIVEGAVTVRERVTLSLTFDHRICDGATAASLLTTICELFENPLPHLLT